MITLKGKSIQLIAEVKTHSPFGFDSHRSWDELFALANEFGDIISIHTDPRWHGSFDLVKKAKSLTKKPILAKGIHATDGDIEKAVSAGADYVLVVGRIPNIHVERCIIEPLALIDMQELDPDMKAVWNSRDLKFGGLKAETFDDARKQFRGWLCQASNIKSISDINERADAILVGTHLEEFLRSIGNAGK